MTNVPPRRALRAHPDLDQLKRQAKELLRAYRAGEREAIEEVETEYRGANPDTFALHEAQLVLARSHGFASWAKLKAEVEGITLERAAAAVRAGDLDLVRKLLAARPDIVHIDMSENDEHRLLHFAVLGRDLEMTRLLLQHGADVNKGIYPHRDATTALVLATDRGYDEIVEAIRAAEAHRGTSQDEDAVDIDRAIDTMARGDREIAMAFLEQNPALINAHERNGWTPLHVASAVLDETMVDWLIAHGADVNRRGDAGRTPIDVAAELRRGANLEGFRRVAELLLRHGAELTPSSAVVLGNEAWLRARHATSSLADAIPYSLVDQTTGLLSIAVKHDRADMLALLLELGLDPDERTRLEDVDNPTYTAGMPLRNCALTGNLALAKILLDAGADPNAQVYASGSATHVAYDRDDAEMVDLLARYGGVPNGLTVGAKGHVDVARRMLDDQAAGRLPEAAVAHVVEGDSIADDLLWGAAGAGSVEIVRMCLAQIDWPREDKRWYTMLREPLYIGMNRTADERRALVECFRLILERHDPAVQRGSAWFRGRSLLHEISGARHTMPADDRVAIATMLIDAGAPLDGRDDLLKSTPLGWACRWGRTELVDLLLSRGADPVERDAEPWATPRAWAAKRGHTEILEMLSRA